MEIDEALKSARGDLDPELDAMRSCAVAIDALDVGARARTITWLAQRYGRASLASAAATSAATGAPAVTTTSPVEEREGRALGDPPSPKEFVAAKRPRTDVERVAVLAYYLGHYRGSPHFKTGDLTGLNTEAAQPRFSNVSNSASNSVKSSHYLADAGRGTRQITALGEAVVEALPDRDAVKRVIDEFARPRRRRTPTRATSNAGENHVAVS